jgi:hypothetical protein
MAPLFKISSLSRNSCCQHGEHLPTIARDLPGESNFQLSINDPITGKCPTHLCDHIDACETLLVQISMPLGRDACHIQQDLPSAGGYRP